MAGKKALKEIRKEHNGPEGHKIPFYFADVSKAMEPNPDRYHSSGDPETITSSESGITYDTTTGGIDEGSFSKEKINPPMRPIVTATTSGANYQKGEDFWVNR